MYFDPEPKNSDLVEVKTGIVSIECLTHGGNAAGLVKTLKQSLSKIGVQELDASDDNPILIGLGSDGASINNTGGGVGGAGGAFAPPTFSKNLSLNNRFSVKTIFTRRASVPA